MSPPRFVKQSENNRNNFYYGNRYKKINNIDQKQFYNKKFNKNRYNFPPYWNKNYTNFENDKRRLRFRKKKKIKSRSPSPPIGSEEHTLKQIRETSEMIKKQIMMPSDSVSSNIPCVNFSDAVSPNSKTKEVKPPEETNVNNKMKASALKLNKKTPQYSVEEIHEKIINHISSLSYNKKKSLICSTSSGYDEVIQNIQKQKRLELSQALRQMCSNERVVENDDFINSVIPDIGIKLTDLPFQMIQELKGTLNLDLDEEFVEDIEIKKENEDILEEFNETLTSIKQEFEEIESNDLDVSDQNVVLQRSFEISTQTDGVMSPKSVHTQTDCDSFFFNTQDLLDVKTLNDAITTMYKIDKQVEKLTKLRQSLFSKFQQQNGTTKIKEELDGSSVEVVNSPVDQSKSLKSQELYFNRELDFRNISEKILVIKVIRMTLLAGSESGKIFYFNLPDGLTLHMTEVTQLPITSLVSWTPSEDLRLFVGSSEPVLREYSFETKRLVRSIELTDSVICMEVSWDFIFVGSMNGNLIRYSLKKARIEFNDSVSSSGILVLKATQEGARRVLLVGSRMSPVCIRDAMSGLHLRTMNGLISPTVYSLLLEKNLLYCGTTFHDILVFSFHDGNLIHKYTSSNSKGIGCMKIVKNLLFASCHNGNIYVYNTKTHNFVGLIEGPGSVILSMEIVANLVIVGTINFKFKAILIPSYIFNNYNLAS